LRTTLIFHGFPTGTIFVSFHLGLGLKLIVGSICPSKLVCLFIPASLCVPSMCMMDPNSSYRLAMRVGLMSKLLMLVGVNIARHVTFLMSYTEIAQIGMIFYLTLLHK
jgi:hypothetical protein